MVLLIPEKIHHSKLPESTSQAFVSIWFLLLFCHLLSPVEGYKAASLVKILWGSSSRPTSRRWLRGELLSTWPDIFIAGGYTTRDPSTWHSSLEWFDYRFCAGVREVVLLPEEKPPSGLFGEYSQPFTFLRRSKAPDRPARGFPNPDGTVSIVGCTAATPAVQRATMHSRRKRYGVGAEDLCFVGLSRTRMVTVGDKTLKEDLRVGSAFLQYLGTFLYTRRFMGDQPSVHCA